MVGDGDAELGIGGGLDVGVRQGEGAGDVTQAGEHDLDVLDGELAGGLRAEEVLAPARPGAESRHGIRAARPEAHQGGGPRRRTPHPKPASPWLESDIESLAGTADTYPVESVLVETESPWRSRWEDTLIPSPSGDQLRRVAEKHGFAGALVQPMEATGVANAIFAIGDDAVLRVPKSHEDMIADTYTESVAAPAAYAAGVRTPALLVFDDDRDIFDVPYTIYERVAGTPLSQMRLGERDLERVYRAVGRELAVLHRDVAAVDDPLGRLDQPGRWSTPAFTDRLVRHGFISEESARLVRKLFERFRDAISEASEFRRFVHQDIRPSNLMGSAGEFGAIIDWGDAGWGDPVYEFRYLPLRAAHFALLGYREVMPVDGDETAEARILWDQVWAAVSSLDYLPNTRLPGTNRDRPGARLVDLSEFLFSPESRHWLDRT